MFKYCMTYILYVKLTSSLILSQSQTDIREVLAVHLEQACCRVHVLSLIKCRSDRQQVPGSLSGLLSGLLGIPASPFGHHLCVCPPYCANQNSQSPMEARQNLSFSLLFPVSWRLRDALLIFPSVGLVYISGGKLKYDSFSSWRVITMKHI